MAPFRVVYMSICLCIGMGAVHFFIFFSILCFLSDKLANCYDSLRNSKKLLNRKTKLRVERLDPVASAIIDNIKDGKCKKTHLELYFGNKSKSGGGKLTDVKVLGKDKAVVTFSDPNSEYFAN